MNMKFKIILLLLVVLSMPFAAGCSKSNEEKYSDHIRRGNEFLEEGKPDEATLEFKNAIQIKPDSGEAYYSLSKAFILRKKGKEAFYALKKTLEKDPENVSARLELGKFYMLGNVLDKAMDCAQAVISADPERAEAYVLLGNIYAKQNDAENAIKNFDKAIAMKPEESGYFLSKAMALLVLKKPDEAMKLAEKVLQKDDKNLAALNLLVKIAISADNDSAVVDAYDRLAKVQPDNPKIWLEYGDYLIKKGRDDEAVEKFRRAVSKEKNTTVGLERIAGTKLKNKDIEGAKKSTAEILSKNPGSSGGLFYQGRIAQIEGRLDEARPIFQRILADNPDNFQAEYFLALTHYGQGNLQQARASLMHILESQKDMTLARAFLAQVCLDQKDYESALTNAKALLEAGSAPTQAAVVYGGAQRALGRVEKARKLFEKLAEVLPENAIVHEQLGLSYYLDKNFESALENFKKALKEDPGYTKALSLAVASLMAQGKTDAAASFVQDHIATTGDSAAARMILGDIYAKKGDIETARTHVEKAIELDPDSAEAYALLAALRKGPHANKKAIADLEKGLEKNPDHIKSLILLGTLYDIEKQYDKANKAYRRVLAVKPDSVPALCNLAWNLAEHGGNIDEALKFAEKAVETAPEAMEANDTLGWIYVKKGVYMKALSHLELAADKLSGNPIFNYHLGKAYAGAGEDAKALSSMKRALQLSPSFQGSADAKEVIAQLEGGKTTAVE